GKFPPVGRQVAVWLLRRYHYFSSLLVAPDQRLAGCWSGTFTNHNRPSLTVSDPPEPCPVARDTTARQSSRWVRRHIHCPTHDTSDTRSKIPEKPTVSVPTVGRLALTVESSVGSVMRRTQFQPLCSVLPGGRCLTLDPPARPGVHQGIEGS